MNETQVFEFYKELYFFEHSRKADLDARMALPVGVITLLAGVVLYFLKEDTSTSATAASVILVSALAAAFSLMLACVYFVRAHHNHNPARTSRADSG
jgi:uncharacterized membrane-anchored protein